MRKSRGLATQSSMITQPVVADNPRRERVQYQWKQQQVQMEAVNEEVRACLCNLHAKRGTALLAQTHSHIPEQSSEKHGSDQ